MPNMLLGESLEQFLDDKARIEREGPRAAVPLLEEALREKDSLYLFFLGRGSPRAHGILAVFHYLPLHLSKFGLRYGGRAGDHPVTEDISDRLLRLPFFCALTDAEQTRVIEAVSEFKP